MDVETDDDDDDDWCKSKTWWKILGQPTKLDGISKIQNQSSRNL